MNRLLACLCLFLAACTADAPPVDEAGPAEVEAPPGTDIWLAPLTRGTEGDISLGEAVHVVSRPGYDNQPGFLPDGSGFWYTSIDELGEADIQRYDLASGVITAVTTSAPESEYSATPLESADGFSAIRVEADSTQRLWRFDMDGSDAQVVFEHIAPVGYHAWADDETAVMFVLGQPATLQVGDVEIGGATIVAEDIGRSIQRIPGSSDVSFVQRLDGGDSEIRRLDPATGESDYLIEGIEGGDFHAWTPEGTLLMGHESRLYAWTPGDSGDWAEIADLSGLGITITRLAVSPDGSWIAIVGELAG